MVSMKDDGKYIKTLVKIKKKVLEEDWTVGKFQDFMVRNFHDNGVTEDVFKLSKQTSGRKEKPIKKKIVLSMIIQTLDMTRNPEYYKTPRHTKERVRKLFKMIEAEVRIL